MLLPTHQPVAMHHIAVESSVEHCVSLLRACCVVVVFRDHLHLICVVILRAVYVVLRFLVQDVMTEVYGRVRVVVTSALTCLVS